MTVHLRTERDALEKLWEQGLSGRSLLLHHSRLVDDFITACFTGAAKNLPPDAVALVALGGYGRRELFRFRISI